jgi:arsenate reductase
MLELIGRKSCTTCRKALALLESKRIRFRFRDYVDDPLTRIELAELMRKLGLPAREFLRKRDKAYRELGLTGEENDKTLIPALAQHPGLLNRPIGVRGPRAVLGRPIEKLLEL